MEDEEIVDAARFVGVFRIEDVEVRTYRPGQPGGMQAGIPTAVQATHLPTGHSVIVDTEYSNFKNRAKALILLEKAVCG